jgi:hypothetical protein
MDHPLPLVYLLTFRTYGTWLPGDPRGWRRHGDGPGAPPRAPAPRLHRATLAQIAWPPLLLSASAAAIVRRSVATTAGTRGWRLHAVQAVSTHVHVVVGAPAEATAVVASLKAYAGRDLRAHLGAPSERPVWGRGAHWRVLLDDRALAAAIAYVRTHADEE